MANSFLRLGVNCAVINSQGHILLSRRGDFGIWNLPGGRLDSGELLANAAAREVLEETGIVAHVEYPLGLYYYAGWRRMNVLYRASPLGGQLQEHTLETYDNRYFPPDTLPRDNMLDLEQIQDILADHQSLHRVTSSAWELHRLRLKLGWRWIKNLLNGRPEPRYPRFDVWAVLALWDESHRRVLTVPASHMPTLPRVLCHGDSPPWEQLTALGNRLTTQAAMNLRWVGLWEHVAQDVIELVFAATLPDTSDIIEPAQWTVARNTALTGLDRAYIERISHSYPLEKVWNITEQLEIVERIDYGTGG